MISGCRLGCDLDSIQCLCCVWLCSLHLCVNMFDWVMSCKWRNHLSMCSILVLTVGLTFPGAAAEIQPDLQCNVTRRPDGSTVYRVSEPRWSNRCTREWLDQNVSPSPSVLTGFIRERLLYFNDTSSSSAAPNTLIEQSPVCDCQWKLPTTPPACLLLIVWEGCGDHSENPLSVF